MENPEEFEKEFSKNGTLTDNSEMFVKEMKIVASIISKETQNRMCVSDKSEYRKQWNFKNGYGISVLRGFGTYGARTGLFEVAVLKNGKICYDSEIMSDVKGHLASKEVLEIGKKIIKLKSKEVLEIRKKIIKLKSKEVLEIGKKITKLKEKITKLKEEK